MASPPATPTIYHRSISRLLPTSSDPTSSNNLRTQQLHLEQLNTDNSRLKIELHQMEESMKKKQAILRNSPGHNPELAFLIEGIKKELTEKNKLLMVASASASYHGKERERLQHELTSRPEKEEWERLKQEAKMLKETLNDTETKLSEALKNAAMAKTVLISEEAINEKLQAKIGRLNQEFRSRLESLECEFTSQQLKPTHAMEARAVQTDKTIPIAEDFMCHSEVLKLQHALETAKDRKIQALNQKLQQANAKVNGLEMKLLSTEKQAAKEQEKDKLVVQNSLRDMEEALVASETQLRHASEQRDEYAECLERMHIEIKDLTRQYQLDSAHSEEDLNEKDTIIAQLRGEVHLLCDQLKERKYLMDEILGNAGGDCQVRRRESKLLEGNTSFHQHVGSPEVLTQVHAVERLLNEKEKDLVFLKDTLQRSKKELEVALSDMAFYQELACHLQKDALIYLSFVQDVRNAAQNSGQDGSQQSLEELLQFLLNKLDGKIQDYVRHSQLQLSCPEELKLHLENEMETQSCRSPRASGGDSIGSKTVQKIEEERNSRGCTHKHSSLTKTSSKLKENNSLHTDKDTTGRFMPCPSSADFASLESQYLKALTSSSMQATDHILMKDLLVYLKSQHTKLADNQHRLEQLELHLSDQEDVRQGSDLTLSISDHHEDIRQGNDLTLSISDHKDVRQESGLMLPISDHEDVRWGNDLRLPISGHISRLCSESGDVSTSHAQHHTDTALSSSFCSSLSTANYTHSDSSTGKHRINHR